ncbi:hypothetical protein ACVW0I_001365 [Bradyrhizobium sp. LM6.11]
MLAAAAGGAVDVAASALRQASPASEKALTVGAVRGSGSVRWRLRLAGEGFPQLSIVFLGEHQKPLSRERVGLIAGPLCKAPVELAIHDVPSLNATKICI